ncbi:hypothetical protein ACHAWX_007636, partial [Stephanocyclus meneghinianus]
LISTILVVVVVVSVTLAVMLPRQNDAPTISSSAQSETVVSSNDVPSVSSNDPGPVGTTSTDSSSSSSSSDSSSFATSAPPQSSATQYLTSNGPLEAKVRMIDPTAVDSYDSCDALKEDIINALKHFANTIIVGEKANDWWSKCDPNDPNWNPWGDNYFPPTATYESSAEAASTSEVMASPSLASDGSASKVQEDSYGTNNQVEGVDEADVVKSDGTHVFAAYGDLLYAWNATDGTKGTSITRMPYNDTTENCTYSPWDPMPIAIYDYGDENGTQATSTIDATSTNTSSDPAPKDRRRQQRKRRTMSMPYYPQPCYQPKPQILSLLLHGTRLTAVVSENNYVYQPYSADKMPTLINDYSSLIVRVYDVSTVPSDGSPLTLLGERKIKGNYNAARSIDSTGVVVTTSYVDTYVMANSLWRSQPLYCGLNNTEYEEKASKIALNRSDLFAAQLISELDLNYGCDHIFKISAMQSGNNSDATNGDLLSQFVSVVSFDTSSNYADQEIPINMAGSFASGYLSSVYVSQDFVAALTVGSSYDPERSSWDQSTFILGFDISSPVPVPFAFAEVPGSPVNQYAADLYDGHFRIATTEWLWSEVNMTSRTTNKIYVLQLPSDTDGSLMELVGETPHLGKPNESIYAVRFIGDKAYVVTFENIDPFLIVDVSNPTDPHVIGELELPGYSSYLHPIEIDGVKLMLGVGQDVNTTTGLTTGIKISLFNITDPENPQETFSFVDENAYSNAQNDFHSFRYLPLSQKLILPKSEYTWTSDGNFDGFVVYDVAVDEIKPSYNISHASSADIYGGCWYNAYMPPRSLVFKSKVTTILSHTVISTDLESGVEEWKLNLDEDLNKTKDDCWSYFIYY